MANKKAKTVIEINGNNDYKITSNPNEILYTSDLASCVGIALIEKTKKGLKRGLIHVYYQVLRTFTLT